MQSHSPIRQAQLSFNSQGTPVAEDFDDVYFSNDDGMAETEFVFLQHNQLAQRWSEFLHKKFTIAETGFGTGLNFLIAWQAFTQATKSKQLEQLHFISFEKFPLSKEQLIQALDSWPQLKEFSEQLIAQYPIAVNGCHRLSFADGKITLDLWFCDVNETISHLHSEHDGIIDAWFLDGFAPSKNPDMWTQLLFNNMARLGKEQCTFATFTAAGFVKRGLAEAGFDVIKPKGFGRKRNMLAGVLNPDIKAPVVSQHAYYSRATKQIPSKVTIIGGGIASAALAYSLAKRGIPSVIVCKDEQLAQGASGNHMGGFYPLLHAEHDSVSQIYCHSYLYARNLYDELISKGFEFAYDWCGVLQVSYNDKTAIREQKVVNNPFFNEALVHYVDADEASNLAGLDIPFSGLNYPLAGWVNPTSLVKALIQAAQALTEVELVFNFEVEQIHQVDETWQLSSGDNKLTAATLVVANGHAIEQLPPLNSIPFSPVRGQVSLVKSGNELGKLKTVLCHKGYITPLWQDQQCVGSSFIKRSASCDYSEQEQQDNLATLQKCFPKQQWAQLDIGSKGRAGVRCTSPDHLPVVGAVADYSAQKADYAELYKDKRSSIAPTNLSNLFVLSALGSRGLCSGPLMAEILASQLCHDPMPMPQNLLAALNPNRFLIRDLIKNKI